MLEKPRRHHGFVDPRGRGVGSSADPRPRLSGRDGHRHRPSSSSSFPPSSPPHLPQPSSSSSVVAAPENGGDFDPVLLRNVREDDTHIIHSPGINDLHPDAFQRKEGKRKFRHCSEQQRQREHNMTLQCQILSSVGRPLCPSFQAKLDHFKGAEGCQRCWQKDEEAAGLRRRHTDLVLNTPSALGHHNHLSLPVLLPRMQSKAISETKGRKTIQCASSKKQGNNSGSGSSKLVDGDDDNGVDGFSIFSSTVPEENIQREREELVLLKEQVEDLQKRLLEKDEVLKTMENSMDQMSSVYATVDELKHQIVEKDLMVKSVQSQLANAKVKLADKQAALEKLEWEAKTSNQKVEKLQGDMQIIECGITAFMQLYEELSNRGSNASMDEGITYFDTFDHLPNIDVNENEMEEARRAYLAAVAAAKEIPTDETLTVAAEARTRLQAFVLTY
ncbi:hypothetical protein Taro_052832 [Colocasia esculenta]|uniref:Uncharacterized protein n=1 Tax=Colocasia esculenta TaxID=4460 RepID=A0A843XLD1_COLES|nr:hypothetical protein [Colocasia esculenta]